MGYVLPGWLDEILDFIGINWPNVDEDDYREMADAMREFADKFEGHGGDAHATVNRFLASSEGYAVDALKGHWGKVKGSHLDEVPKVARLFAKACDVVADVIYGMKVKAEIELGAMAASAGIALGAAIFTGGLSALLGAAQVTAMRELIRRIIKEAQEEIVERLLAEVTEPVTAKLEKMTEDMILDLADDAISLPSGEGGGDSGGGDVGGGHDAKGGMNLNSAGGNGGSGGGGGQGSGRVRIDPDEFDNGAAKLSRHASDMQTNSLAPIGRAKGAFGRTKGRDPFTQAFDSVLDGALSGSEKALKKVTKHIGEGVPGGVRSMAKRHRDNESSVADSMKAITSRGDGDGARPADGSSGGSRGGGDGNARAEGGDPRRIEPQPGWHGRSAGKMRHHRGDALQVDHLSPEMQRRTMVDEARRLADSARDQQPGDHPAGQDRLKSGCAGSMLHNGVVTSHSSTTAKHGMKTPDTHPVLQQVLDEGRTEIEAEGGRPGIGHGKCAEVSLISDRLHQLDPDGSSIRTPDDAREALSGAMIHTRQIGDTKFGDERLDHGDYKPPCRSCERVLPAVGVHAHN